MSMSMSDPEPYAIPAVWRAHVAQLVALGARAGPQGRAAVDAALRLIRDLGNENERLVARLGRGSRASPCRYV